MREAISKSQQWKPFQCYSSITNKNKMWLDKKQWEATSMSQKRKPFQCYSIPTITQDLIGQGAMKAISMSQQWKPLQCHSILTNTKFVFTRSNGKPPQCHISESHFNVTAYQYACNSHSFQYSLRFADSRWCGSFCIR